MSSNPELIDYVAFFEVEPTFLTPGTNWYDGARFDSVRGNDRIVATIAPDDGEFSFKWWNSGNLCVDIALEGVVEWKLECSPRDEMLLLKFQQELVKHFVVRLKPHICVSGVVHRS